MDERDKIIAKIKESAYENVNKKLEEERKKTEDKINNELVKVERCLQYIQNKMVYKIVKGSWTKTGEYVLADENTFFKDYSEEPQYSWAKGIEFFDKPNQPLFKVNGVAYYDMRYIIRDYEERFKDYYERLGRLNEKFREISEAADELKKQEPLIKNLIEQYKKVEIDESYKKNLEEDLL